MLKGLILDCDGVIVQSDRVSARLVYELNSNPLSLEEFFSNDFQKCVVGEYDLKVAVSKYLKDWGWNKSVDDFLTYWFDPAHNRIDGKVKDYVAELRKQGLKVFLATNNEKYRMHDLAVNKGLKDMFDAIFTSSALQMKKTNIEFFTTIADVTGISPGELIVWDNDPNNVAAAKKAGMSAEVYTTFEQFTQTMRHRLAEIKQ